MQQKIVIIRSISNFSLETINIPGNILPFISYAIKFADFKAVLSLLFHQCALAFFFYQCAVASVCPHYYSERYGRVLPSEYVYICVLLECWPYTGLYNLYI